MKKARLAAGLGVVVFALGSSVAHAALIVDNGNPSLSNPAGSNLSDTQQAQDFYLASNTSLTSVRFWTLELSSLDYLNSIFWEIRTNASGTPGNTVVASGTANPTRTAATAISVGGTNYNQTQNDFNVNVNNLASGFYWLTLHNGAPNANTFTDFYWSAADTNATVFSGQEMGLSPATSWYTNDQELAFQLYGTSSAVPEPGTLGLVGLALLTTGLIRKASPQD